jgi:hypothetical protein
MRKELVNVGGALLFIAGLFLVVSSPTNTVFEGWAMLARALGGQALIVCAVDLFARTSLRRGRARWIALLVTSAVLFPLSALVFLMSKESGSSWGYAALILVVWFFGSAIFSSIKLIASRRG